jgi:hypothetical protein
MTCTSFTGGLTKLVLDAWRAMDDALDDDDDDDEATPTTMTTATTTTTTTSTPWLTKLVLDAWRAMDDTPSLASIGFELDAAERVELARSCPFLRTQQASSAHYTGATREELGALDDAAFAARCATALSAASWVSWSLAASTPALLVQVLAADVAMTSATAADACLYLVTPDHRVYALTQSTRRDVRAPPPFAFRRFVASTHTAVFPRLLVLQGEVVATPAGVGFFASECLANNSTRLAPDRQSRMALARAIVEGEPSRAPLLTRVTAAEPIVAERSASAQLLFVEYKPHMTALHARALVDATAPPPLFLRRACTVNGLEVRASDAAHVRAADGAAVLVLTRDACGDDDEQRYEQRARRIVDGIVPTSKT